MDDADFPPPPPSTLKILAALLCILLPLGRCAVSLAKRSDTGAFCSSGADCWSGACLGHTAGIVRTCVETCETRADCGAQQRCAAAEGGRYCVTPAASGTMCHVDDDCLSLRCELEAGDPFRTGRCAESCGERACEPGEYCRRDPPGARCELRLFPGERCERDEQCLTDRCSDAETSVMEAVPRTKVCS